MLVLEHISLYWYLGHNRLHALHNAPVVGSGCLKQQMIILTGLEFYELLQTGR